MHWLKYYRQPSPHAPHRHRRGIPMTVNPEAMQRVDVPPILTQAQRDQRNREMRALAASGVPRQEIAERYGLQDRKSVV